ncbi:monovalent cation/H(+) antiporter subunit G [Noviherbaspirillum suwonense]|jgi:multicomponent K+:H+ antiporter subunit G|uniref:Multisubunit potassium/proton antiporter, PhaG subunit n=1 Tax=Noviherbaspirillum suwonense TaxID=1224511 RepID=A0ABY1QTF6_9BURK|nr:monovalent cation/H(+) antiporter subunit G [Noviherbaspirillum suwonense]SMP77354.1 multisubunit potassium/proton antiporter, PhaG subunit [Noviherbaspirillum suwonense]
MIALDAIPAWAAIPVAVLLIAGGSIIVVGALGLLRLPNFYQRIHGPAITVTLGTGFILLASMLFFSVLRSRVIAHELIIAAFLLMTAPVVAMMIMRAAVYRDLRAGKHDTGAASGEVYRLPRKD